ncbi:hypothetical protein O181_092153, partial [Austropuccinia psidii MF-1]|nr:hypothetical protein [Austropuccinia psidii MF-1]
KEKIETASTVTSIIPASTVNYDHNSTVIIAQNHQPEPISSELISLDIRNTLQKANNLANNQEPAITPQAAPKKVIDVIMAEANHLHKEKGHGHCHKKPQWTYTKPARRLAAQRVPDPCRSVEKLHEFLPTCEKIPGPSQHLQVTQWMAFIDGKEVHDAFNSIMEEKQPSNTQASAKNSPSSHQQQFQHEKAATHSNQGQRQGTSHKNIHPGIQNPKHSAGCHGECISDGQNNDGIAEKGGSQVKISEIISDIFNSIPELYETINDLKTHVSDKDSSICNNLKKTA